MMMPGTVSSHRLIGAEIGQYAQMVDDDNECWAAEEDNRLYLQIEFCQPTYDDPFSDWQYDTAVSVCRSWATKYGFPIDREHILGHEATDQGKRWGKTDVGRMFDWDRFIENLQNKYEPIVL